MKKLLKKVTLAVVTMLLCTTLSYGKNGEPSKNNELNLHSAYVDKIKEVKVRKDAVKDFGMESSVWKDQSAELQSAIAELSELGGGVLYLPYGTYLFRGVRMMSNVHIVIAEGATLKPYWGDQNKVCMFSFSNDNSKSSEYIENCSIRAEKGSYIVNYSEVPKNQKAGIRFAAFKMVKNFSVADADIKDNYTTYCAFSLSPADAPNSLSWEVDRPTNGEFRHCKIYQA
ncbi:MAG: glycosyl hydrolase family 28-related protein, partial [Rikenellaceae bacterium]